jgi:hypothetical protein
MRSTNVADPIIRRSGMASGLSISRHSGSCLAHHCINVFVDTKNRGLGWGGEPELDIDNAR